MDHQEPGSTGVEGHCGAQVVLTLHGINTEGRWQEEISGVLEPHFRCVALKYDQYRRCGQWKLCACPWAIGLSACCAGLVALSILAALVLVLLSFPISWIAMLGAMAALPIAAAVGLFGYALWEAKSRRRRTVELLKILYDERPNHHRAEPPHVIAHSLGTFLVGRLLQRFANVVFDRVILAASVLPPDFPWISLTENGRRAFTDVRNDMGAGDWVMQITPIARRLVRGLGDSGRSGFDGPPAWVHDVEGPHDRCRRCPSRIRWEQRMNRFGTVHNVPHEYDHSDAFLGLGHARQFWLPYLWGFEPDEFREFVELCQQAERLERERMFHQLVQVERKLHRSVWSWTQVPAKGATLERYARATLVHHYARSNQRIRKGKRFDEKVDTVIRLTWCLVTEAALECAKPVPERRETVARALHPWIAVNKAAQAVQQAG